MKLALAILGLSALAITPPAQAAFSGKTEIDFMSFLVHTNRNGDWVEGFDNNYIGLSYYWQEEPDNYTKGGYFINSYGNPGAVLGMGQYTDTDGIWHQGWEAGITYGYESGEGSPVFLGYAGKLIVDDIGSVKVHANPMFVGITLSIKITY